MNISSDALRTLQLAPLWVLRALAGRCSRFDDDELAAFWDTVVAVALRTPEPARQFLTSTSIDRTAVGADRRGSGRGRGQRWRCVRRRSDRQSQDRN